jgi:ComF family protein
MPWAMRIGRRRLASAFALTATALRGGAQAAVAIIYPPACIHCACATGAAHALCASCWSAVRFIERPYCERLGTPFDADRGEGLLSPAALADPPVYGRARAAARYDDPARALVHRLKYGDRLDLAQAMASMMVRAGCDLFPAVDVIVPVPLHPLRLWWRRFNQAALLASAVAGRTGLPVDLFALARIKRTRPQVGLTRPQRGDNLQGAFRVPDSARPRLAGRRVLLVDDVLTTGATANAASRALLRGGAASVDVLAFARVVTDGLAPR